jgi:hypothetical protein
MDFGIVREGTIVDLMGRLKYPIKKHVQENRGLKIQKSMRYLKDPCLLDRRERA